MLRMKESAGGPANGDPVSWECLPHRPTQRDIASWAEGPTLQATLLAFHCPFPHALPATLFPLCAPSQVHLAIFVTLSRLLPPRPGFIISSCLSLLLLWGFGSPDSVIAHHPALSLPSSLPRSHQIDSRSRLGWPPMGCSHVLFWYGPSRRKYKST